MQFEDRVRILTEGAKYDVSCSSSGSDRTAVKGMTGNCAAGGICHSFTADGRCVSLLKILLSNNCEYDCKYCVNRRSNDLPRARLSPVEICELTMNFYKRNYIEGLFLSSAVDTSPDITMKALTETVELLRTRYGFRGYIHLKAIPGADKALIDYAARFADRMSLNIELPSEPSLKLLAPQKKKELIISPMRMLSDVYIQGKEDKSRREKKIPAGQTTQMIIGASPDTDGQIIRLSEALYRNFQLKRVYYSAYVPVNESSILPALPPDTRREHRLYEADWLLRFYGYKAEELLPPEFNLDLDIDPKCAYALRNFDKFPLEINTASYEMLLRVPGIGVRNAYRIFEARKHNKLDWDSLKRMRVVTKRAKYFITADGKFSGGIEKPEVIRSILAGNQPLLGAPEGPVQIGFFDAGLTTAVTGEF
jgi:putative DNA modification/repair radical SAM protein